MSKAFSANSIVRATLLVTGSTYVAFACGLVASTLTARSLGPSDYGHYAYIVWLSGVLVMLMNNGLTTSMIRFVSEASGRGDLAGLNGLHQWFWQRQWVCVGLVCGGAAIAIPWMQPSGWTHGPFWVLLAVLLAAVPKAWYLFGVSLAKGHGRFGVEATTMSLMSLGAMLGAVLLMLAKAELVAFLVLFVAVSLAHPLLLARVKNRLSRDAGAARLDHELAARVRPHLLWTALLQGAYTLYGVSMTMLFLNHYADSATVAYFSVAVALTRGGIELLSAGLNSVLMPLMAHAFGEGGQERTGHVSASALRMFHFCGMLLIGVGLNWASPIVTWMYGAGYEPAILAFQVLIVVGAIVMPLSVLGSLLSTTERQRLRVALVGFALLTFALSNWWLVPEGGLHGALLAYGVCGVLNYLIFLGVAVQQRLFVLPVGQLLRLTLAILPAGAVAALPLLLSNSLWAQLLAGLIYMLAYPLCTIWSRAWAVNELRVLSRQAHRLGRLAPLIAGLDRWGRVQP